MASERKTCTQCHGKFSRPLGSRRVYCETCRPPRKRPEVVGPVVPGAGDGPGAVEAAVRAELERVERLSTIEGTALLALARDADRLTGAARAAAVRELVKLKPLAFEGTKPAEPDRVDDLEAARAARLRSA